MIETRTAGGVVLNKEGKVLVVDQNGNSWSLPKGHIEEGETPEQAAQREITEESGITELTLVKDLGEYQRHRISLDGGDDLSELKNIRIFLFTTDETDLAPLDPNNKEARWVPKDEVANLLTHKKDKEFYLSVLDKLTHAP